MSPHILGAFTALTNPQNASFLTTKTTRTDIYGRYVVNVFLEREGEVENNSDLQKAADEGIFNKKRKEWV